MSDPTAASRIMLSLLFEMLDSSHTYTKVHSFNLLFNLSVHMNLLEEVSSLEDSGTFSDTVTCGPNPCIFDRVLEYGVV